MNEINLCRVRKKERKSRIISLIYKYFFGNRSLIILNDRDEERGFEKKIKTNIKYI